MSEARSKTTTLDPLQREAVAWVQRLVSGRATTEDSAALQRWCARSAAHRAAFTEASRVWGEIASAARSVQADRGALALNAAYPRRTASRRVLLGGGLATAAAAAYAVVDPPFRLWPSLSELNADYRTATGEQRQITLAHRLAVRMNTQTSLVVRPAEGLADRVELIAGEASFVMEPQARRSLIVLAAAGSTIGTDARFDVRHLQGDAGASVCVTCFDGDVRIERGTDRMVLGPGQQVRYGAAGLGRVATVDAEAASAWQRGIVVFRATPLAEVVDEINRYRPGRIILVNAELGRKPVSGRFRADRMNEILSRLEQAFAVRVRMLPGGIVLLG
ncbi:FecR domain-containing protein [Reyranella sp. CPCC 100927]|uniref:FecR family protein n=1 Tax=Reyranella sp. CPCC 100927 TaxID=2599616 RepID=UPI0011B3E6CD|nr:FecR domain-containing protein [Reyranella sp. CPCC 100927]TWT10573.1 DUF4974 domain-containing protein [Reyranella sp. CPCC 100927]